MRFVAPLIRGTLVRRYKRFLADVVLAGGETVTVHCPNSGSLLSVDAPEAEIWLSPAAGAKRTLPFTWELIRLGGALVGINTGRPNSLVAEAIAQGIIAELAGYDGVRREVRYGRNSRIDLLLEAAGRPKCFVEIKNVTMKRRLRADFVEFPDCVTERGVKHLIELSDAAAAGHRAVMLFVAQRGDGDALAIADDIDSRYAEAFDRALAAGVEAYAYGCAVDLNGIRVHRRLSLAGRSTSAGYSAGMVGP